MCGSDGAVGGVVVWEERHAESGLRGGGGLRDGGEEDIVYRWRRGGCGSGGGSVEALHQRPQIRD